MKMAQGNLTILYHMFFFIKQEYTLTLTSLCSGYYKN